MTDTQTAPAPQEAPSPWQECTWFHEVFADWELHPKGGERPQERRTVIRKRMFFATAYSGYNAPGSVRVDAMDGQVRRVLSEFTDPEDARRLLKRLQKRFTQPPHWEVHRKLEAARAKRERRVKNFFTKRGAVWRLLQKHSVEKVTIQFSGSGDSGGVDSIEATDPQGNNVDLPQDVSDELEETFLERLEYGFDNEGCFGTFEIAVSEKAATGQVGLPATEYEDLDFAK